MDINPNALKPQLQFVNANAIILDDNKRCFHISALENIYILYRLNIQQIDSTACKFNVSIRLTCTAHKTNKECFSNVHHYYTNTHNGSDFYSHKLLLFGPISFVL